MKTTYVGSRRGAGAVTVEVYGPDGVKPLGDRWQDQACHFDWGQDFSGSVILARALLSDAYGVAAAEDLAVSFAADVVSRFPSAGFAVDMEDVCRWGTPPAARRLTPGELVEMLGGIAVADEDDDAELLRRIMERSWSEKGLRH